MFSLILDILTRITYCCTFFKFFFFFKQKTAYEMRISDWSSDVCSSDLIVNYDVRESIAAAERAAARSSDPAATFSREMSNRILGNDGIRNRYLQDADNGRATFDITGPHPEGSDCE